MYITGVDAIATIRAKTDTILLAFSGGKDAVGAWLECRKHFPHVVPYYMYIVPGGLEFIDESLKYYEGWFGERIHRIPHPSLYRMLNNFVFQPPERTEIIRAAMLPNPSYLDSQDELRDSLGLGRECYVADGVRAADSPIRQLAWRRYGPINHNTAKFSPIIDWNIARLADEIEASGVRLPVDYRIFGRSFDGLDFRFLEPLKRHFPRDYERILQWFPLADIELFRRGHAI